MPSKTLTSRPIIITIYIFVRHKQNSLCNPHYLFSFFEEFHANSQEKLQPDRREGRLTSREVKKYIRCVFRVCSKREFINKESKYNTIIQ